MPKRLHIPGAVYAVTTVTRDRYPYFDKEILCDLFARELGLCATMHDVHVYAFKINPEHVHMITRPEGESYFSRFMFSLKKNFAHNANRVMGYNAPRTDSRPSAWAAIGTGGLSKTHARLLHNHRMIIRTLRDNFVAVHGKKKPLSKFRWQKSFYLHRIVDERDFVNQMRYIRRQWTKHRLERNAWCYVDG